MTAHLDTAELEDFVQGTLDGTRLAQFEARVSSCDACAASLMREARLELALVELGTPAASPPARRWSRRAMPAVLAIAATAAAILLVVARPGSPAWRAASVRSIPGVVCPPGTEQATCVQRAHGHGLFVEEPAWAGPPPLGDRELDAVWGPALRSSIGPSRPPFPSDSQAGL